MSCDRARSVAKRKAKMKMKTCSRRKRIRGLESVLDLMGMEEFKKGFRSEKLGELLSITLPRPRVVLSALQEGDADLMEKAAGLSRLIEDISIPIGRKSLSYGDFLSFAVPIYALFNQEPSLTWDKEIRRRFQANVDLVRSFFERHEDDVMLELKVTVMNFLIAYSRLDGPTVSFRRACKK